MRSIAGLALLSDCSTAALVDSDGTVVWWPGLRFDGPSCFSRLLDRDAGHFAIGPDLPIDPARPHYLYEPLEDRGTHGPFDDEAKGRSVQLAPHQAKAADHRGRGAARRSSAPSRPARRSPRGPSPARA